MKISKIRSHQIFYFLLFLLAFASADIIFHTFLELYSTLSAKMIFATIFFFFLKDSFKPPTPLTAKISPLLCGINSYLAQLGYLL